MKYQSLKGFRDFLPAQSALWHWMERRIESVMELYGFGELRLPMLEATELFARGVGEGTDVIGKEMYSFMDRSDPPQSISLRPELTAGAARVYVEHEIAKQEGISKWYYMGPAFRYEQPQAGRYRQFSTVGVELIGSGRPEAEVEVIGLARAILRSLGITNVNLFINSIGMPEERQLFRSELVSFLNGRADRLSEDSRRRIEQNPLRVLDSKDEADIAATADAPDIREFLQEESRDHFARTCELLDAAGVSYALNSRLVRGLDYYTRTVFEFVGGDLGAQNTMIGGGRYDNLIGEIGGNPAPAIGFGAGLDRLLIAMEAAGTAPAQEPSLDVYLVALDDDARTWSVGMAEELRRRGLSVEFDLQGRSMKAQMREANRKGTARAVIVGSNELENRLAQVKNMVENSQEEIPFDQLGELLSHQIR